MNAEQLGSPQSALVSFLHGSRQCFRLGVTFEHFRCSLLGLMADLRRKSIEAVALACGVRVRTLLEFLSMFVRDHGRLDRMLRQRIANRTRPAHGGFGVIDATGFERAQQKAGPGRST